MKPKIHFPQNESRFLLTGILGGCKRGEVSAENKNESPNGEPINCTSSELSIFLQGVAAGYLPTSCLDTTPSAPSRLTPIASKSFTSGSKTVSFRGFPSLQMFASSTANPGTDSLMSSASEVHARDSQLPGKCSCSMTQEADCSSIQSESLARFDHRASCWRIRQKSFAEPLGISLEKWPDWAMTHGAELLELAAPEWTTCEKDSGWLRTPCASDGKKWYVSGFHASQRLAIGRQPMLIHQLNEYHDLKKGWANPEFWELMMDWPIGWTDLRPLGMDRFRAWLRSHGKS